MSLMKVRLELARTAEQPEGSRERGYAFTAPLTGDGHLDPDGWQRAPEACRVHRFWRGERDQYGLLVHGDGGRWAFHYDRTDDDEDEPIFRLDQHRFVPGEYVSVTEHDGVQRTFRVVEVIPAD
ncbi:MAG TPA: hypothetical protein VFZ01_11480 [Geminicoccaceae bacterium]